jgi:acetyl esterase
MPREIACALEDPAAEVCRRQTASRRWRELGLEMARAAVGAAGETRPPSHPDPPVEVEDIAITVEPTQGAFPTTARRLAVRIYRPAGAVRPLGGIVYLHGAGWTFHPGPGHDRLARSLASRANCVVLLPAFARAPEAPHPVALEQCYQLLCAAADDGLRGRLSSPELTVVGDGTGGALAAGLTVLVRDRRGPELVAQVLVCPALDPSCDTPSHRAFARQGTLDRDDVRWLWEQYLGGSGDTTDLTAAPLRAEIGQLHGLPPALVITAEVDVLRDEGEHYASKLRQAGGSVLATRYLGTVHGFCHLPALRDSPAAEALLEQVSSFLGRPRPASRIR